MKKPSGPTGIHHLAVMTKDMKGQLEFFTQVVGLPLVALYDMHGVPGAWHAFVRLDDATYLAFAQVPGVERVPSTVGVTHAGTGVGFSAPGTMQHVALRIANLDELLALRDRVRSHGVVVMGPIDHGMCQSVYFAGPEGLTLEAACSSEPIPATRWVDPTVAQKAGITASDLQRFREPAPFLRPAAPVPQPAIDPSKPQLAYPEDEYRRMVAMPDDVVTRLASVREPPVPA
jgi:catechol 2,3-dioxygenase-like lactoylglutathione lyase family enzyme